MTSILFLEEFGKAFVPEKLFGYDIRSNLRKYLLSAGMKKVPYRFFGILFWVTTIITYFIFIPFIFPRIQDQPGLAVFFASFISWAFLQLFLAAIVIIVIYFFLNIKVFKRTKEIEDHLADFLVLVSTNLKGGLSLEQSLWASIRPEFGLLAQEMTIVSKRVMTGSDLSEALAEFSTKYDSPTVRRNLDLVVGEIESGGRIVKVIDKVIETLKKTKALKAEMSANTITYMIFIGAVVVVIAPALFALAYQLLGIIINFTHMLGSSISGDAATILPISFDVQIDVNDFKRFSMMALVTISVCSSMIISIIEKGDIKSGLKYIPAFSVASVVLYVLFMVILESVFGGVF